MNELTVVTFKWKGWRGEDYYKASHVHTLQSMLEQHLTIPHRFVCITDDPRGLRCENMALWTEPNIETAPKRPNCYRRLKLFSGQMKPLLGNRILQIDLDCVILGNIDHLPSDDTFKAMYGKAAPINGSLWQVRPGAHPEVWNDLTARAPYQIRRHEAKSGVRHYGSDQAWMAYKLPDAPKWGPGHGLYHYTLIRDRGLPKDARVVFFAGHTKPWSAALHEKLPELYDTYQRHAAKTLLMP